jgi:carboxypeptidase C (cathepsin A)
MSTEPASPDASKKPETPPKKVRPPRPERTVETTGSTRIGKQVVRYRTTARTLNLKDEFKEDKASVFSIAFVKEGEKEPAKRPVTFCFNGGPGSSSVWLHLGALGPRRVAIEDGQILPAPPYELVDNDCGILDLSDLVFIDPVGTGFSRSIGETEGDAYAGVKEDIESVADFIVRWTSANGRWTSPKFVIGESYGTFRAAGLSIALADRGLAVNGLVLVSLALDFQTFLFEPGNDLPNALFLPTYAATAWYHERLPRRPKALGPFLDEARRFAIEEYMPALLQGSRLAASTKRELARELARFTGLDAKVIEGSNLRIEDMWFTKQVLGGDGRTVGRLDSRFVGEDFDRNARTTQRDPSYDAIHGPYGALVNDYLRREIGWDTDDAYEILSGKLNEGWRFKQEKRFGYPSVTSELRRAILMNPQLEVLVCDGLFDVATPFFGSEFTTDHLDLPPDLAQNVRHASYEAGHMMYLHRQSHEKLKRDLAALYPRQGPGKR